MGLCLSYHQDMPPRKDDPVSLDEERTRKFLQKLAEHPFLAIVVTDEGQVHIYSADDLEPEHISRIKEVLEEIRDG